MAFPSTFVDIQNSVAAKLRLDASTDGQKVKDWINQVYTQVCLETEAFQTYATMTTTANDATYTLPSAVGRIKQMFVTPAGSVRTMPLIQTNLDEILRRRQAGGGVAVVKGWATHYCVVGLNQLELYPTPGSADVITIYYVGFPAPMSSDSDVPSLPEPYASKVLEYGALAEGADFKSDPQESEYRQLFESWEQKLRSHLIRLQGSGPGLAFPIAGEWYWPPHDPSIDLGW